MKPHLFINTQSPRLSRTICTCLDQATTTLISRGQTRCLQCGAYIGSDNDIAMFYAVERAISILLDHGFRGQQPGDDRSFGKLVEERLSAKGHFVSQQRIEFHIPKSQRNILCSVRWFVAEIPVDYQYLNKTSSRAINGADVPDSVKFAVAELSKSNTLPGSLRLTEASVNSEYEGRKFVRMEQSYCAAEGQHVSLILRVEISWDNPRGN